MHRCFYWTGCFRLHMKQEYDEQGMTDTEMFSLLMSLSYLSKFSIEHE